MLLATSLAASCARRTPEPIDYGQRECDYCRMVITDQRYGAELVTTKGKVYEFDSIECMISYYRQAQPAGAVRGVWVSDFTHPGTLIPASSAVYLRASNLHAPMGRGLLALAPGSANLGDLQRELGAPAPMNWTTLLASVPSEVGAR